MWVESVASRRNSGITSRDRCCQPALTFCDLFPDERPLKARIQASVWGKRASSFVSPIPTPGTNRVHPSSPLLVVLPFFTPAQGSGCARVHTPVRSVGERNRPDGVMDFQGSPRYILFFFCVRVRLVRPTVMGRRDCLHARVPLPRCALWVKDVHQMV